MKETSPLLEYISYVKRLNEVTKVISSTKQCMYIQYTLLLGRNKKSVVITVHLIDDSTLNIIQGEREII